MAGRRDLEDALRRAAARFVEHVLAIVEASAEPGAARLPGGPGLPRVRRRAASLEKLASSILSVLSRKSGLAVSDIAGALGVTPREITRPITWLLVRGRVTKTGERRGTRYSLARRAEAEPTAQEAPRTRKPPRAAPKKTPPRSTATRKRARSTAPTQRQRPRPTKRRR